MSISPNRKLPDGDPMYTSSNKRPPFVGHLPCSDQSIFFGRDPEVKEAHRLLKSHRLLLLSGRAGVGKTSFLNAGLIPALEKEGFEVLKPVFVGEKTDEIRFDDILNIYISSILSQWSNEEETSQEELTQKTLAGFLDRRKSATGTVSPPRLIVFENLETLFTHHPERRKEREDFFYQVRDALAADPLLRVIFVIRKSCIKQLKAFADLLPEQLEVHLELEALRADAAVAAITLPMANRQITFEKGVAEALVSDLSMIKLAGEISPDESRDIHGEFVEPTLLQIVCERLWRDIPDGLRVITQNHRTAFADVDRALSEFYEKSLQESAAEAEVKEETLRTWFEQSLITDSGERGRAYPSEEESEGLSSAVLEKLEDLHLIRSGWRDKSRWYKLLHDRLIRPVTEANRSWRMQMDEGQLLQEAEQTHRDLENQAIEWVRLGRKESLLLRGEALVTAKLWMALPDLARHKPSEVLAVFVRASLEKSDGAHIEKIRKTAAEEIRRMEVLEVPIGSEAPEAPEAPEMTEVAEVVEALEIQKESAEEVLEQVEKKPQKTKGSGKKMLAMVLVFIIGAVLGTFQWRSSKVAKENAEIEYQRAQQQSRVAQAWEKEAAEAEKKAEVNRLEAEQAKLETDQAKQKAAEERQRAEAQTMLAAARTQEARAAKKKEKAATVAAVAAQEEAVKLTREARSVLSHALARDAARHVLTDPTLSLLLAMQAISMADSGKATKIPEAEDVLYQAMYSLPLKSLLPVHTSAVNAVIFGRGGKHLVSSGADGTAKIWNPVSGKMLRSFSHGSPVTSVAYRANGRQLATAGLDGQVRVWQVSSGKPLFTVSHEEGAVKSVAFSPDQRYLASAGEKGIAVLWDVKSEKELFKLKGHKSSINQIVFSADGKYLATAGEDGTVAIWSVESGNVLLQFFGHERAVNGVAFSPDGKQVASASNDGTVRVWDVHFSRKNQVKHILSSHTGEVLSVAFSPDGRRIATGSNDRTMKLWNAKTGEELAMLSGHRGSVTRLAFSPDGRYLATAGQDKTIRLYSMEIKDMMALVRKELPRSLSSEECKKYLHTEICPPKA